MKTRKFRCSPGAEVCTQVDPMGLETRIQFDEEGLLETSDPGIIAVLERLPGIEEVVAVKPKPAPRVEEK